MDPGGFSWYSALPSALVRQLIRAVYKKHGISYNNTQISV